MSTKTRLAKLERWATGRPRPLSGLLELAQAGRWADLTDGDLDRIIDMDGNGAQLRAMTDAELDAIIGGGA